MLEPGRTSGLGGIEYVLILALVVILAIAAWPMVTDTFGGLADLT